VLNNVKKKKKNPPFCNFTLAFLNSFQEPVAGHKEESLPVEASWPT
jgi:hypothetical protein